MSDAGPQGSPSGASTYGERRILGLDAVSVSPAQAHASILQGITFSVAAGECLALVGPSGSGKTTLLRTIALALPVSTGRIFHDGRDVSDLSGPALRRARRHVALVAQKHDLVDALRVDRNVMAGNLGRWSTARSVRYLFWSRPDELREAEAALAAVGLPDKPKRRTSALSGGEQQRVAIARALVQAPNLLLADEPVASLDPATANNVLSHLTRAARERGMALIMSLHQPDLARCYCDRILTVRGGTVIDQRVMPDAEG